jgi:hypothetical protein
VGKLKQGVDNPNERQFVAAFSCNPTRFGQDLRGVCAVSHDFAPTRDNELPLVFGLDFLIVLRPNRILFGLPLSRRQRLDRKLLTHGLSLAR